MKSLSILLIDDDEIERLKFKKVCNKFNSGNTISEAKNGEKALAILKSKLKSFDLIICDINMPRMNGLEFLKISKKDSNFKKIPIVIMSTSENKKDLKKCYDLGISGYFTKPLKYSEYIKKVTLLLNYWEKASV